MNIPETEEEQVLVCNAALMHYNAGSFSDVYDICETPEQEETVTKYKKLIEGLSDCIVDALIDYMPKMQKGGIN